MRADFAQSVGTSLAHRVGLLCSNPECRAATSGPKSEPERAVNVGVAAHITAASLNGPRYDPSLTDRERRSASNGIWLCQTCAKLIDSDVLLYTTAILTRWKAEAEREAQKRIGKTGTRAAPRSLAKVEQALKRDQKVRDELTRAFLKPRAELMATSHHGPQYRKFRETEFIVRRLDDSTYPDSDPSPGISGWFKLEIFDFYFNGIEGILNIECVLMSDQTGYWSQLTSDQSDEPFPCGFHRAKVFRTGKIPWRNIRHYDLRGDEYYPFPHLYCLYADNGMPYEGFRYYVISEDDSYHFALRAEAQIELAELLKASSAR
jgi:hypothetical protein